ncbi:MAG TPA: hypothetical protein VHR66_03390 [Gemmataceae bacterium]|jgi:hypothetical protein|nr:hypothetical protein [Gemmataceae bacterium]
MRDLFSDLPPKNTIDGNYSTRMVHLWAIQASTSSAGHALGNATSAATGRIGSTIISAAPATKP